MKIISFDSELMNLAMSYSHCNMNDETTLAFRGELYLLKPLLSGIIMRIDNATK